MKKVWEYSLMEYNNQILRVLKFGKPVRYPEGWTIEWGRL